MKKIFFNAEQKLRNGWWILVFAAILTLSRLIYKPIRDWLKDLGVSSIVLEPQALLFILLVSWCCLLLRRQRLADIGLSFNRSWWQQMLLGTVGGIGMMGLTALLMWSAAAVTFNFNPQFQTTDLMLGAYTLLLAAALEELLFRGFVFQRLLDGIGIWPAQLLLAAVFATGHWDNPGMDDSTKFWASLDLALGSLMLGFAYIKTGSLALPLGLHFGWNWSQGYLLGFQVSGHAHQGWLLPQLQARPDWQTGGSFGAEATVFSVLVVGLVLWLLWRWRGVATVAAPSQPQTQPVQAVGSVG